MGAHALGVAAVCLVALAGCVEVDGGAIDFSWVTYCEGGKRPGSNGASCSCEIRAPLLTHVQLSVVGLGDGAAGTGCPADERCLFEADRQSGTTEFLVPPGDYQISVVPLDGSGAPLGGPGCVTAPGETPCWQTPSPIRRTVVNGEVVSLGTLLIVIPDCPEAPSCPASGACLSPVP